MMPVLFTIGSYQVYTFGFFLSLSFLLSTFIVWKSAREELKEEEYLDAFLYTSLVTLVTARIVYILFHFSSFGLNLLKYVVVRETPGLSLLGGLIGGAVFLYWYSKRKNYEFFHLSDLYALAFSFALIFVKVGEQLAGGSFGKETQFFLGVKVIGKTGRYHPAELYEAILLLFLFCALIFIYGKVKRKKYAHGLVCLIFVSALSIIIFALEFLKTYPVYLYGLSFKQVAALIILIIVAFPLWKKVQAFKSTTL